MNNNEVAFIRTLQEQGYTQKQVVVIMNSSTSTISRIYKQQTYVGVQPYDYKYNQELENRKMIFDIIVECREIPGGGYLAEQDKAYIKLLKHCHVPWKDIAYLYRDLHPKNVRPAYQYESGVTYRDFDSTLIGIDLEDYKKIIK